MQLSHPMVSAVLMHVLNQYHRGNFPRIIHDQSRVCGRFPGLLIVCE